MSLHQIAKRVSLSSEKEGRTAFIRKEKGKYCVRSESNKDWSGGCYDTKAEAEKALARAEMFKHMKKACMLENLEFDSEWLEGFLDAGRRNREALFGDQGKQKLDIALRQAAKSDPRMASIIRKATVPGMEWLQDDELLQISEEMVAALKKKSAGDLELLIPKMFGLLKKAEWVAKAERQKKQLSPHS